MSPRGVLRGAVAWAVVVVLSVPLLWMAGTAVTPAGEYVAEPTGLWPAAPTAEHFAALAQKDALRKGLNSLIVALGTVALALAAGYPAAFALVTRRFPARLDIVFLLFVLVVKLAPPIALAIPLYHVLRALGLLDTLAGLVLVYQVYALPLAIWMLTAFIRDVPRDIDDAARIDGASLPRRIWTIYLPLTAPGVSATAVLVGVLAWNEFLYALLFIQSPSLFTLPTFLATLITEDEALWGQLAAVGLLASLPILLSVGLMHRALTRSFAGGLK
ncbi:MAG: carbohydrate ABC transporter permease [Pikeienuella sp.]